MLLRDGIFKDIQFTKKNATGVQSRLNLSSPNIPELEYIQKMCFMSALHPSPKRVLFLGMGGGSLPKFWIDNFPEVQKTIVDLRPLMFQVAQEHFEFMPDANTRLVGEDANKFLQKANKAGEKYDIIYVDIYMEGPADIQNNQYFWNDVKGCLAVGGISCSNIWDGGEHAIKAGNITKYHKNIFGNVFKLTNQGTYQYALCGTDTPSDEVVSLESGIRAIELTGKTNLNFTKMMQSSIRQL